MRFTLRFAAIAVALLLAACQPGSQSDRPATGGPAERPTTVAPVTRSSAERNAVAAFSRICSTLNRNSVVQRAAQFGFAPARNETLPPDIRASLEQTNGVMFLRSAGEPAMLLWYEPQTCELWVGGVKLPGLEEEFSQLLGLVGNAANSQTSVTRLTPNETSGMVASNGTRARLGAFIAPRELIAAPPRIMLLRSVENPGVFQGVMIHHVVTSRTSTQTATPARTGPPKDPVR